MKREVFILVFAFYFIPAYGGFEQTGTGARTAALGGAFVGLADDVWAIHSNPAGLSRSSDRTLSFYYSPQPFGLSELRLYSFVGVLPTSLGTFGGSVTMYGYELYKETSFTFGYGSTISGLLWGGALNYRTVSIRNYGSAGTFVFDVGILASLLPFLSVGITAKNINAATIGEVREKLPQSFSLGVSYSPVESATLLLDYQKELGFPASPRAGFEYWIISELAIRGGATDEPAEYSGGIGLRYSVFGIDYAIVTHQDLGLTHSFSLSIVGF